jgi:hypothetical protein
MVFSWVVQGRRVAEITRTLEHTQTLKPWLNVDHLSGLPAPVPVLGVPDGLKED